MGQPYPPVPSVISVLLRGTTGAELWENRLHYQYSGTIPTPAALAALGGNVRASWATQVAPLVAPGSSLTECLLTDLNSNTGAQGADTTVVAGTRTGGQIAANAAVLISYPSTIRYRGGHPRTYLLAGVTTDLQNPFTWSAAFQNTVATNWGNFTAALIGQSSGGTSITAFCSVRQHGRFLANGGPPHYVLTTPIVTQMPLRSFVVQAEVASQKGRIGRRSK